MTKEHCSHELDNIGKALDQMSHEAEVMTSKVFDALIKNKMKPLDDAEKIGSKIELEAKQLMQTILSADDQSTMIDSAAVIEVSGELQKIIYSVDKMIGAIRSKIDEGILFSDRAVVELKDFFSAVIDGFNNIHVLVLTHNPVLADHIINNVKLFEEKGRKYAEEHEERMIKGVCLPKSSLVYLIILESLKDTLRFIKGIAKAITKKNV